MNRTVVRHVLVASFALLFATAPAAAPKRPPKMPSSPTPANGASGVPTQVTLKCSSDWATRFELYFDTETVKTASGCGFLVYTAAGTSHQWRIRSSNKYGFVDGPVWSFATVAATPLPEPTPTPPAPTSGYGPSALITCPTGVVDIFPGSSIQTVINANLGATLFCLRAGVHPIARSIVPKSGNVFVGEFGAILDGTGWASTDLYAATFQALNGAAVSVTIRNLTIQRMPQSGIQENSGGWLIENNAIHHNGRHGVSVGKGTIVRNTVISDNAFGNYAAFRGDGARFEHNEIARGGNEQKIVGAVSVAFRGNWVHHNPGSGIWYDSAGFGGIVEDNLVEDNAYDGIAYEATDGGLIRRNTLRRNGFSGGSAIFVSVSKGTDIAANVLEDNFRAITYFVNCDVFRLYGLDLANNTAHDNSIRIPATSGALANQLTHNAGCADPTPWTSGAKNNRFDRNQYVVPSLTARYWVWGFAQLKNWSEWQALGNDATSTVRQP